MTTLYLILGDQLTHSLLQGADKQSDVIFLCEVWEEATYVKHHPKKIALILSAMRHFAVEVSQDGYQVDYVRFDDAENTGNFTGEILRAINRHGITHIVCTFPGEYRLLQMMRQWQGRFGITVEIRADLRFISSIEEFASWANAKKQLRMEFFYRQMRRKTGLLMRGDEPEGGQWNYDAENRKPPTTSLNISKPFACPPDGVTQDLLRLVAQRFGHHFGDLEPFNFAVTRADALKALQHFVQERLPSFGEYQDAMLTGEPWMYHAHISFYINCGLLLPLECAVAAEKAYQHGKVPLNAAEGFIRQIIGWREFVRGIYWLKMPEYKSQNYLQATRKLPAFYWTAETKMNCLKQCVTDTKENAYAHHIQRLMVLGNFSLLSGIQPDEVNEWYLSVYADAYEWVELPNVTGMALFADGGLLASKPYAASGAYINKMSNYCKSCIYKVKERTGPKACPFNYLYWDFLIRNKEQLKNNPRMAMIYKTLSKMAQHQQQIIENDARLFLDEFVPK